MTNLIIIDASGSMSSRVDEVKGSLAQLVTEIKADKNKKQNTIIVDFSGQKDFNVLTNVTSSKDLVDISENYKTRGSTALFDAVSYAFSLVPAKEKKVFVSIITDGEENDSKEVTGEALSKIIKAKKKLGWAIVFMGANESCLKTATSIGISVGNTMTFNLTGGYSGFSGMMGSSGYSGVASYARTAYMSSTSNVADDDLLMKAEQTRLKVDKQMGVLEEVE